MTAKMVNILLVEDDEVDVKAVRRAFKALRIANPIVVAKDALEALEILRRNGRAEVPRPYLILLDLNLPRMNGIEFLKELRGDAALRDSIVFVLSTSRDEQDRSRAYRFNVAGYIVKSDPASGFMEAIAMLDSYWRVIEFP